MNEILTRKVNSKTIATFETELAKVEWDNLPDGNAEAYFQSFFDTLSSKIDISFPLQKLPFLVLNQILLSKSICFGAGPAYMQI